MLIANNKRDRNGLCDPYTIPFQNLSTKQKTKKQSKKKQTKTKTKSCFLKFFQIIGFPVRKHWLEGFTPSHTC